MTKRDLSWFDCRFERFFFFSGNFIWVFLELFSGILLTFYYLTFCDLIRCVIWEKTIICEGLFWIFIGLSFFRIFTGNWVNFVDKESENIVKRMLREGAVMGWPVVSVTSLMGEKRDLGENWEPKEQNLIADCPFPVTSFSNTPTSNRPLTNLLTQHDFALHWNS